MTNPESSEKLYKERIRRVVTTSKQIVTRKELTLWLAIKLGWQTGKAIAAMAKLQLALERTYPGGILQEADKRMEKLGQQLKDVLGEVSDIAYHKGNEKRMDWSMEWGKFVFLLHGGERANKQLEKENLKNNNKYPQTRTAT